MARCVLSACFPNVFGNYTNEMDIAKYTNQFGSELEQFEERIAMLQTQLNMLSIKRGFRASNNSLFNKWTEYGAIKRELKLVKAQKKVLKDRMRESSRDLPSTTSHKWGSNPILNGIPFVLDEAISPSTHESYLDETHKENIVNNNINAKMSTAQSYALRSFESSTKGKDMVMNIEVPSAVHSVMGEHEHKDSLSAAIPMVAANNEDDTLLTNMNDEFCKIMDFLESNIPTNPKVLPPASTVAAEEEKQEEASSILPIVLEEADLIKINELNCSFIPTPCSFSENDEESHIASSEESFCQEAEEDSLPSLLFVDEESDQVKINELNCTFLEEDMEAVSENDNLIHFGEKIFHILPVPKKDDGEQQQQQQATQVPSIDDDIESKMGDDLPYSVTSILAQHHSMIWV